MTTPVEPLALDLAVVRLRDASGRIVGAGFLVGPERFLTCAHVMAAALGDTSAQAVPEDVEVHLDFPLVDPPGIRTAKVTMWRAAQAEGASDIAGPELTSPLACWPRTVVPGGRQCAKRLSDLRDLRDLARRADDGVAALAALEDRKSCCQRSPEVINFDSNFQLTQLKQKGGR